MHFKKLFSLTLSLTICFMSSFAHASIIIPMYFANGQKIGTVKADDTIYGVVFTPKLNHLSPGLHGFHIHTLPNCDNGGMAAGGHLDPVGTKKHMGPYEGNGHLGDLPVLIVDEKGRARLPILAPRLKLELIEGHALMIHAGGDNYSDHPQENGGGGARIACGVIGYAH